MPLQNQPRFTTEIVFVLLTTLVTTYFLGIGTGLVILLTFYSALLFITYSFQKTLQEGTATFLVALLMQAYETQDSDFKRSIIFIIIVIIVVEMLNIFLGNFGTISRNLEVKPKSKTARLIRKQSVLVIAFLAYHLLHYLGCGLVSQELVMARSPFSGYLVHFATCDWVFFLKSLTFSDAVIEKTLSNGAAASWILPISSFLFCLWIGLFIHLGGGISRHQIIIGNLRDILSSTIGNGFLLFFSSSFASVVGLILSGIFWFVIWTQEPLFSDQIVASRVAIMDGLILSSWAFGIWITGLSLFPEET